MWVDVVDFTQALAAVERLIERKQGGAVFTPNVDHVVKASRNPAFREAYDRAELSFADGMPLIWVSRFLGCPLPERVAAFPQWSYPPLFSADQIAREVERRWLARQAQR